MSHRRPITLSLLAAGCLAASLCAASSLAAKERLGKTFRNTVEGYSLRVPAEWEQVPLQPNEQLVTAKFSGSSNLGFSPDLEILRWKLDVETPDPTVGEGEEPKKPEDAANATRIIRVGPQNFSQWFDFLRERLKMRGDCEIARDSEIRSKDRTPGRHIELDAGQIQVSIGTFRYGGVEFAVVYMCHERDWKGAQRVFAASIRSFQREEVEADAASVAAEMRINNFGGTDEQYSRRVEARQGLPDGWDAFDSENYVYLYNADRSLVRRLSQHIEGIRAQLYEKIFPPDREIEAISVVRICKDRDTYMAYGGPPGSAGYWNHVDEELVFYEDENNVRDSFAVLYHEAFHQYIFYSVGDIAPHIWYNEGHGDYFAGAKYRGGRFTIGPFQWRLGTFKNMQATGRTIPLDKFIRMSKAEYYSNARDCYAQGWAFVYYLREEARLADWKRILPTYFDTLKEAVANVADGKTPDGRGSIRRRDAARSPRRYHHLEGWGAFGEAIGMYAQEEPPQEPPVGVAPMEDGKTPQSALDRALEVAFDGIDLEQLERAFLKAM
jgi:hypothetical protein